METKSYPDSVQRGHRVRAMPRTHLGGICSKLKLFISLVIVASVVTPSFQSIAVDSSSDQSSLVGQSYQESEAIPTQTQHAEFDENLAYADDLHSRGKEAYYDQRYEDAKTLYYQAMELLTKTTPNYLALKSSIFHELGQVQKQAKNWKEAISYHEKALHLRREVADPIHIAVTLKNLAQIEAKQNNLSRSLDYAFQGLEVHKSIEQPEDHAELMVLIGSTYRQLNRLDTSLIYLDLAVSLYTELDNKNQIANSQNQMGLLYKKLGKFSEARAIYESSAFLPDDSIEPTVRATAFRELAKLELADKNYDKALMLANKAHVIFLELNSVNKAIVTARTIAELHSLKNEADEALQSFNEALALADQANRLKDKVKVLEKLGHHVKKTDASKALDIYSEALVISKKADFKSEQVRLLDSIMRIFEAREQYRDALSTAKSLIKVRKAIYAENEKNKLASAKAELEVHIIENELDSLREKAEIDRLSLAQKTSEIEIIQQANLISELELTKNRYASFFLATMVLICLCFAIYIYRVFIASRRANKKLHYLANYDALTSCLNRRGFFNALKDVDAEHNANVNYAIIMADIDYFKAVNDNYGHDAGDMVLVEVGKTLKARTRKNDIVARFGGEEFCIALQSLEPEQAEKVAEDMRKKIEALTIDGIEITCSFGVAYSSSEKDDYTELISKADKALYTSKANGRNRVTVSESHN
ncbi:GGDEF domain-containing protein [Glaciecola sp. MH2013]|uniref:tetratricopeptide repeat-containing diguanylate cyclase n=1 Tax=Glaciecola sp. MH2013 TaxID=2785524 RepID=UPI0018A1166A|nr:diguanylate cyclase [Glaciecola sp. MH2013]MBF7073093.1 GGDEF domain-containing protein [Glaciecola sp. MH2013]